MKVRTTQELLDWQPPEVMEIISQGVLHPGSRAVVFGRWGSWKSMLTMHLGFCLSRAQPWVGFDTTRSPTMIAQVEIPEAKMRERVQKYLASEHPGAAWPEGLWFLSEPFLRLDRESIFKEFQGQLEHYQPRVLILDPFYRLYSGDINDNHQITRLLDKLDKIALESGMALILVGHTKKLQMLEAGQHRDWGQELIGGSYIMDWVDTAIAVEPDHDKDTDLRLHFVKVRHAAEDIGVLKVRVNRHTLKFGRLD